MLRSPRRATAEPGSGVDQQETSCGKSAHRIFGYQGYQSDIIGLLNGYQEKIDQISIKYMIEFNRISKISAGYPWICQTCQVTVVKE